MDWMHMGNTDNEDSKMGPKAEPVPECPMPLAYHAQPLWDSLDVKLCSVTSESPPSKSDELPSMWTLPWCPSCEMVPTEFCELLGATKGCVQGPVPKTAEAALTDKLSTPIHSTSSPGTS